MTYSKFRLKLMNLRQRYTLGQVVLIGMLLISTVCVGKVAAQNDASWTEPFPPFRIADNLYYVGSKGLANYLIATPKGHILINSESRGECSADQSERRETGL